MTPDDDKILRMLAGANFGPGASVILPSGQRLSGDEAQALTSAYADNAVTLAEALGDFRAGVMDHVQDRVHHWSDEQTEDYGFRMSLGDSDAILMHLPDGRTVRVGIAVTVVEAL